MSRHLMGYNKVCDGDADPDPRYAYVRGEGIAGLGAETPLALGPWPAWKDGRSSAAHIRVTEVCSPPHPPPSPVHARDYYYAPAPGLGVVHPNV